MRFRLAGVGVLAFLGLSLAGVALADTPTVPATQSPTPGLPATPSPSVAPAPTATPVVVDGRVCRSGRLINGFLILGRDDPPPGCLALVTVPGPPILYGLALAMEEYRLHSVQAGIVAGTYTVAYTPASGSNAGYPAVKVLLDQTYYRPVPTQLLSATNAMAAPYLPHPGIEVLSIPTTLVGCWIGEGGRYCISIETNFSDLTLEDAARVLVVIPYPSPEAPDTGSGLESDGAGTPLLAVAVALLVVGSLILLGGTLGAKRVKRREDGRE